MSDEQPEDLVPGLFSMGDVPTGGRGRTEEGLEAAVAVSSFSAKDSALVNAARVAARALDNADRIGGLKGGYLVAQLLRPYQDALEPLGLAGLVAPTAPAGPAGEHQAGDVPASVPEWWTSEFGTPS